MTITIDSANIIHIAMTRIPPRTPVICMKSLEVDVPGVGIEDVVDVGGVVDVEVVKGVVDDIGGVIDVEVVKGVVDDIGGVVDVEVVKDVVDVEVVKGVDDDIGGVVDVEVVKGVVDVGGVTDI